MTNKILRVPANSQVHLAATHDASRDKFDVREFTFNYLNTGALPTPWGSWNLNETSGTRVDGTGHGHDATPINCTYDVGKIGNCFKATNANQRLAISGAPDLRNNQLFTFSCWFKYHWTGSYGNYNFYLFEGTNSNLEVWVDIFLGNGKGNIGVAAGNRYSEVEVDINPDTWYFLCVYYNGTGIYVELNNAPWESDLGTTGIVNTGLIYIGHPDAGDSGTHFEWLVDEANFWTEALTQEQRTYLYNDGVGRSLY